MQSSLEVKKENEGKLSVANSNEKYLYSRVVELEKRNQRLEKKVNKLKRKKKELKQEVAKLRAKIQPQGSGEVEALTCQDEDQGVSKRPVCNISLSLPYISKCLNSIQRPMKYCHDVLYINICTSLVENVP